MRFRQLERGDAPVLVAFEGGETHGAEEFLGRGELGQQPLEVGGALEAAAELDHPDAGPGHVVADPVLAVPDDLHAVFACGGGG